MRFSVPIVFLLVASAGAQESPQPTTEERLRALEAELRELKAKQPAPQPAPEGAAPISNAAEGSSRTATRASLTIGGYAEVFYQWNFNEPSNGITNYRGFDNRHNAFTMANAVIDAQGQLGPVGAHVALQVGHTPETYYLVEPFSPGTNAAGTTSGAVWKFLQQAIASYKAPLGRGLLIEGGIFLSPIGPEGMAIKDQWNWSRSDLFFGLPFYHTGLRVSYPVTDRITTALLVVNGWNSVVDNNPEKSLAGQVTYNVADRITANFIYFTGVERNVGAAEGRPWRHLFDAYVALYPRKWLALLAEADGGFEPNSFGTSGWAAGALYARVQPVRWLYLAARGDYFYEWVPAGASPIFWPTSWVSSATATADVRPVDNVSFRVEYRHDQAAGNMFFDHQVPRDLMGAPLPNTNRQDTLTFGMTTWF